MQRQRSRRVVVDVPADHCGDADCGHSGTCDHDPPASGGGPRPTALGTGLGPATWPGGAAGTSGAWRWGAGDGAARSGCGRAARDKICELPAPGLGWHRTSRGGHGLGRAG
jgi:hypothetical protein